MFALKRIRKELEILNVHIYEITDNYNISFKYKNKNVLFKIPPNYPFMPPDLFINSKKIIYSKHSFPSLLWDEYYSTFKVCKCCQNIKCIWTPALTMKHVLNEYEQFIEQLLIFKKKKDFKKINLPDDIIHIILSFF